MKSCLAGLNSTFLGLHTDGCKAFFLGFSSGLHADPLLNSSHVLTHPREAVGIFNFSPFQTHPESSQPPWQTPPLNLPQRLSTRTHLQWHTTHQDTPLLLKTLQALPVLFWIRRGLAPVPLPPVGILFLILFAAPTPAAHKAGSGVRLPETAACSTGNLCPPRLPVPPPSLVLHVVLGFPQSRCQSRLSHPLTAALQPIVIYRKEGRDFCCSVP